MTTHQTAPLPITREECLKRGWDEIDIVLVTGDAYVDHPSFGVALIGRLLEQHGYRVAILAQPRHDSSTDFSRFGRPRLFFGITAGNLDSIVANYTGNGKVRDSDSYSPGGNPWRDEDHSRQTRRRPDRASIRYANLAREAYKDTTIILGGVEASLRRFIHFDYKQNRLRNSVLADAKADLLIYGMGEKAVLQTAAAIKAGEELVSIEGCCIRLTEAQFRGWVEQYQGTPITLPSWKEMAENHSCFMAAEQIIDREFRRSSSTILVQRQQSGWIIQNPPQTTLSTEELDAIYALPFTRKPHPSTQDIPAHRMIRHSITIVRGCAGNCSFCAITRHQGPEIQSRSIASIIKEAKAICQLDDFTGTISDLGGPTANLYGTQCTKGGCSRRDCLYPQVCKHLEPGEEQMLSLLEKVANMDKVQHVYISSGLRMELLLKTPKLLKKLIQSHTPGAMKIAPEHTESKQLELMHKESHDVLKTFIATCREIAEQRRTPIHFTPYVISGHPGSSARDAENLVGKMRKLGLKVKQFQDFTPTPGTISTAMYYSGCDRKMAPLHIPSAGEKQQQRAILERAFIDKKSVRKKKRPQRR